MRFREEKISGCRAPYLLSWQDDLETDLIVARLRLLNQPFTRVQLDTSVLTYRPDPPKLEFDGQDAAGLLSGESPVWCRRIPEPLMKESTAPGTVLAYLRAEAHDHLRGALYSVAGSEWMNSPRETDRAALKLLQVSAAGECGLRVPPTLFTSSRDAIGRFLKHYPDSIVKPITGRQFCAKDAAYSVYTTRLETEPRGELSSPVCVQARVRKRSDLRIYVIDDLVLGARIVSDRDLPDWRLDAAPQYSPWEVPSLLRRSLRKLHERMAIRYSAVDLIEEESGQYVFLEINPGGQWGWIETEVSLPVTEAITSSLLRS